MPKSFLVKSYKRNAIYGVSNPFRLFADQTKTDRNLPSGMVVAPFEEVVIDRLATKNAKDGEKQNGTITEVGSYPDVQEVDLKALFLNSIPVSKPFGLYYIEKSQTKRRKSTQKNFERISKKCVVPAFQGPLPQTSFNCKLCQQVFQDTLSLAQHKCAAIKHIEHRCPECDKVFSCPANLASHRRWHRPRSPSTNRPRKSCKSVKNSSKKSKWDKYEVKNNQSFPFPENLTRNSAFIFKETVSHDPFSRLTRIGSENSEESDDDGQEIDVVNEDSSDKNLTCLSCGKVFLEKCQLQAHMRTHSYNLLRPCHYCGQHFKTLAERAKHILTHAPMKCSPTLNGRFPCSACSSSFFDIFSLRKHLIEFHC